MKVYTSESLEEMRRWMEQFDTSKIRCRVNAVLGIPDACCVTLGYAGGGYCFYQEAIVTGETLRCAMPSISPMLSTLEYMEFKLKMRVYEKAMP